MQTRFQTLFLVALLTAAAAGCLPADAGAGDWRSQAQSTFSPARKEEFLSKAIAESPADPSLYFERAEARAEAGNADGADADYTKALEVSVPGQARLIYLQKRAGGRTRAGRLKEALADYSEAIAIAGNEAPPSLLALLYTERGRVSERLGADTEAEFDFAQADRAEKQALAGYRAVLRREFSPWRALYTFADAYPVLQCALILLAGCVTLLDRRPRIRSYPKRYTAFLVLLIAATDLYALIFNPGLYYFDPFSYLLFFVYLLILFKDRRNLVISNITQGNLCRCFFEALERNGVEYRYQEGKAGAELVSGAASLRILGAAAGQLFEIDFRKSGGFPKLDAVMKDARALVLAKRLEGRPKQIGFNFVWGGILLLTQLPRLVFLLLGGAAGVL